MRIASLGRYPNALTLAARTLRQRDPAARAALLYEALTIIASPMDLVLGIRERRLWREVAGAQHPLIVVVGPPRSGTTVVYQTLVKTLPVSYFNNLTSVFPRSPITVNSMARRPFRNEEVRFRSFYGRTARWWEPNDLLSLWERWLGGDLRFPPAALSPNMAKEMLRFFGAWTSSFGSVVSKSNALNVSAHLVAAALPQAHFICLSRHPVFLAQSLLIARRYISGTANLPYGVDSPTRIREENPLKDVCSQVQFHRDVADSQRSLIGSRFWMVDYESFCARPSLLVERVARQVLGLDFSAENVDSLVPPIKAESRQKLPDVEFTQITREIARLGLDRASGSVTSGS